MSNAMVYWLAAGALIGQMTLANLAFADPQIPADFHGVWQPSTKGQAPGCIEIDSDIRMTVRTGRIDFHEGGCTVQRVELTAVNSLELQAQCWQEGSQWLSHEEWALGQSDGLPFLAVRSLVASSPYEALYGKCPASTMSDLNSFHDQALCYHDDLSSMEIRPNGQGTADIQMEATQNAHICWLNGTVTPASNGYHYSARLEDGTQCELSIVIGPDGGVSFQDREGGCKNYHCGERAWFEDINFHPSARQQCE